ncbi:diaminopimelate epimerase [Mangrovibacterium diazotrophicum]|uniref:Diaminopimelate epimerase n=1 Tax=Mangrovibacterium diazotrophicum TaxID=1261403 RepID=A0A419WAT0_9BACT|nr:diaminopimelate epimerase [Mangrovibacterium diazotrophicum]RKD92512.1 diaminopimelate epimerase [Mangrovibacterium diazotrophicum]
MNNNFFVKSHGLGNDYIVMDSHKTDFEFSVKNIQLICDVHYGIGSDGILVLVDSTKADFGLRILNPDGSEAEKSGNGLRIFAKFLFDYGYTTNTSFSIDTLGGVVRAEVIQQEKGKARMIKVDMGAAIFEAGKVPVKSEQAECLDELLELDGTSYRINCVSVGNPHCVVIKDELEVDEIMKYGTQIENHTKFPNRINVQFAKVISPDLVEILIWERGAGWTLASGSSSSAVAAVMVKKGLTNRKLTMKMPGGELKLEIDEDWQIHMTGEVREIASGVLSAELLDELIG